MKSKIAQLGSVCTGTMRPQDLIPEFCSELRRLGHRCKELTTIEKRCNRALEGEFGEDDAYFDGEESSWDVDALFDMLNEHAPAWSYFGAHPGDGSDYGFWVSESIDYDFDGLKVADLSEIPADYAGEVLHVNDHGNETLYTRGRNGHLYEIWAIV